MVHGLRSTLVCVILVPGPRIEPVSPVLVGKFLTTGPPGKSPIHFIPMLRSLDKGWDVDLGASRVYCYEEIGPHKILL